LGTDRIRNRRGTTAAAVPAGTHVLGLGVRLFYPVAGLARASGWPNLVYAAFLPINYFLEFGFYGLAGVWFLRRMWQQRTVNRYELLTLTIAATSLLLCTFVRSTVIQNNDLGYRGMLLAQFILLLWAVDLLDDRKAARRPLVMVLIVLGIASSIYEAASLRLYAVVSDVTPLPSYTWLNPAADTGRRLYEARGLRAAQDGTGGGRHRAAEPGHQLRRSAMGPLFRTQNRGGWPLLRHGFGWRSPRMHGRSATDRSSVSGHSHAG